MVREIGRMHHDIAGSTLVIFDGLGHNPFWEDPRRVAETINAFLKSPL